MEENLDQKLPHRRTTSKEIISQRNKAWRAKNPDYNKQWFANHPTYQRTRRSSNPEYLQKWLMKYPHRDPAKQAITKQQPVSHLSQNRSEQLSYLKPNYEEYENLTDLSPKTRSFIQCTGCKYLINDTFCNQPKQSNSPYCHDHSIICFIKPKLTVDYG